MMTTDYSFYSFLPLLAVLFTAICALFLQSIDSKIAEYVRLQKEKEKENGVRPKSS